MERLICNLRQSCRLLILLHLCSSVHAFSKQSLSGGVFKSLPSAFSQVSGIHGSPLTGVEPSNLHNHLWSRQQVLHQLVSGVATTTGSILVTIAATTKTPVAQAFEGGVGGLGKTKPDTGVDFLSPPTQTDKGFVAAELLVAQSACRVTLQSPWPLLSTTDGLEVRNVPEPESAFLQIVQTPAAAALTKKLVKQVFMEESILSSQGKFGAYGAPTDVKVQAVEEGNTNLWQVTFTALTPGLRESDRKVYLKCIPVGANQNSNNNNTTWLVLVTGTTLQRFSKQQGALRKVVDSFQVVAAPATRLRETPRVFERQL